MKNLLSFFLATFIILFSLSTAHAQSAVPEPDFKVVSSSDPAALAEFQKADLDKYYPDLMRPENQNGDVEAIFKAWGNIHQQIYAYLVEEEFEWDSDDPQIQIVNRIYFNADGTVKHYFFRILNNSVSHEKRMEFKSILEDHFNDLRIDLSQLGIFAQCGKSAYPNS